MKRIIISCLLILTFIAYAAYIRLSTPAGNSAPALLNDQAAGAKNTPVGGQTNGLANNPKSSVNVAKPAPVPQTTPTPSPAPVITPPSNNGKYKDGEYTGNVEDAFYGNVQVKVIVSGGQITNVQFLDYPHDRNTSIRINTQAMPVLIQETMRAQSASVDVVSGATATSEAFIQSLTSALSQAA